MISVSAVIRTKSVVFADFFRSSTTGQSSFRMDVGAACGKLNVFFMFERENIEKE